MLEGMPRQNKKIEIVMASVPISKNNPHIRGM